VDFGEDFVDGDGENAFLLLLDTGFEAAAGAHFYASRPAEHVMPAGEFIFGLGVIGPDPLVPETDFVVKDGHVTPPDGPGLGITVDEKALDELTLLKEAVA